METSGTTAEAGFAIREERAGDEAAIEALHRAAFDGPGEATLVARLREAGRTRVSLVATAPGEIAVLGHVLFTPVLIPGHVRTRLMGLAPLAVRESWRGRGVGSALVRAGLDACRALDIAAVAVLGDPAYYGRFGFEPGAARGIDCEYEVPDEAFALVELRPGALDGVGGTLFYDELFSALEEAP